MLECVVGTCIEEIFLSAADSEREKTKERIRECVGDERKISWSWDDKIRRVGSWKIRSDMSGGGGRLGVSGIGRGFCEGVFLRGMRRGSPFWSFGLLGVSFELVPATEGMSKMSYADSYLSTE